MKRNEECKIIQDLLPNYIENLTNEETNKFIENHVKECENCKKILKDMGEEVILDKIDDLKKIDYLKKIKFRNRIIISLILSIAIIAIIFIINIFGSIGGIPIDQNGKPEYFEAFRQWITGENNISTSEVTNFFIISKDNKQDVIIIITFDKNDICIGARYCVGNYTEKQAIEKLKELENTEKQLIPTITNVKRINNKIIYNYNYWNGKNKKEIKEELLNNYDYVIQEI